MSEKRHRDGVIRDNGLECEFSLIRPHATVEGVFLVLTALGESWAFAGTLHFDAAPINHPQGQKGEKQ